VSDPPHRRASESRAGADAPDAHDVDRRGRPRHWAHLSGDHGTGKKRPEYGEHEDRTPTPGYEPTFPALLACHCVV
jgi:hypothetical protein